MTLTPMLREDDDLLAAEYVLGVLPLPDRITAEARIKPDFHFASAVAQWENRLSDLNADFDPVAAPNLLPQIEARLFGAPAVQKTHSWRGWFAGALTAAALIIAVVMFVPVTPDATLGTTLMAEGGDLQYRATYAAEGLTLTRVAGDAAATGQVHQLWLIAGDAAPVSLGLVTGDAVTVPLPSPVPGVVLAISLEPAGGSPTGLPTGPVLVTGVLQDI